MPRIRAVLFDVDGTLLDSNDAQAHAWLDALRGHGHDVSFDVVRARIGASRESIFDVAGIAHRSLDARTIAESRNAVWKGHYLADVGPFPGARALVDRLHSRGIVCVAVGMAPSAELALLLRAAAVADRIDLVVGTDDLGPNADLATIALDRAGVAAENAIAVGDSAHDIAAASRAGVAAVAFRCGGSSDFELEGALAIYDGPADLLGNLGDSPFAVDEDFASGRFPSRPPAMLRD